MRSDTQIHSGVDEAKNNIFSEEVKQLKSQLISAKDKIREKTARLNIMSEKLKEAETQIKTSKAKELQLRNVILQNSEDEGRSDEEIVQIFCGIRQKLLSIAHSQLINWQSNNFPYPPGLHPSVKNFYHQWQRSSSLVDRRNVLRTKLYCHIHYHILKKNFFGFSQGKNSKDDGNNIRVALEHRSQEAERFLIELGVPDEQLTNWRLSTMKCAQLAQCTSLDGCQAPSLIFSTLQPLLHPNCGHEQIDKIKGQIQDVCQEAINLRLIMRQSKDFYWCQLFDPGNIVSPDTPADIVEVQGRGNAGRVIVSTLFGALLKHAKSRGEQEPVVLERAHVLVRSA